MRILVTGAAGFLGHAVCRELSGRHEIHGVWRSRPFDLPGVAAYRCDLTDATALRALFERVRPQGVVHAAALAQPNACQENPELSRRVNVELPARVAELCAEFGARLAFTSTDLVFDGKNAPYAEDALVSPLSLYGQHKGQAEAAVLDRCETAVVCRMALMFGPPAPSSESFVQPMLRAMAEGGMLTLFTDEFRTPLAAVDAARGLELALITDLDVLAGSRGPGDPLTSREARRASESSRSHDASQASESLAPDDARQSAARLASAAGRPGDRPQPRHAPSARILHLGGPESISRFDFGRLLAEAFSERRGPARAEIKPLRQADLRMAAPRPQNVSLDIGKARGLGFAPASPAQRLRELLAAPSSD